MIQWDGGALDINSGEPVESSVRCSPNVAFMKSNGMEVKFSLASDNFPKFFFVDFVPLHSNILQNDWVKMDITF